MTDALGQVPAIYFYIAAGLAALFAVTAIVLILRAERARSAALLRAAALDARARAGERAEADLVSVRAERDAAIGEGSRLHAELAASRTGAEALTVQLRDTRQSEAGLRTERDTLARDFAGLKSEIRGFERQIADLKETKDLMRQEFKATAGEVLKSHGETFKAQNSEQLGHLLAPLKNDIDAFKNSLTAAHNQNAEQHGSLKQQIQMLSERSVAVSKEAENLTRALKGNVQMQGAWGEMIVDTILQRLGLREGQEYSKQDSFTDAEGRVRTDYLFNLPNGEQLIIDSKVSLVDFERYANAEDDESRAGHLASHARSVRNHVKGLAGKDYPARVGTRLDYVIMFVPIEAALGAALAADETLTIDALGQKVAIATPTTLTTTIQTIAAMWNVERQNQNAKAIADRAGKLYDKFVNFTGDLGDIGSRIEQAGRSYEKAMTKLTGAGGLVRQAEMLKAMGAKTSKAISSDLLEAAEATDRDELLRLEDRGEDDPAARVQ